MNIYLDEALVAFRDEVRAFIGAHVTAQMRDGQSRTTAMFPEPEVSADWERTLAKRGWLVPLWPVEWGGTGWTHLQRFIFETECALAGAPLVYPMGIRLMAPVLLRFGTDTQKRHYLPRLIDGIDYWCQGFSEPGSGSDLASLQTTAVRDGDHYVVNGTKLWTTHAHHANWMFALVRTDKEVRKQDGITFLLVDMRSPGFTVRPIRTIGGDHDVNEVHFDNVRVPVEQRVGSEGQGWECAKYLLEFERGAGIVSPRLRAQLKRVADALRCRLSASPDSVRLQQCFGEANADLDAFEWLEAKTLAALRPGTSPGPVASVLKLRASRLKQSIGALGVQVLGPDALRWRTGAQTQGSEYEPTLVPEYCNSRAFTIFGGAAEIQLSLIARGVMNAPGA